MSPVLLASLFGIGFLTALAIAAAVAWFAANRYLTGVIVFGFGAVAFACLLGLLVTALIAWIGGAW